MKWTQGPSDVPALNALRFIKTAEILGRFGGGRWRIDVKEAGGGIYIIVIVVAEGWRCGRHAEWKVNFPTSFSVFVYLYYVNFFRNSLYSAYN